jgi:hypothetical protein
VVNDRLIWKCERGVTGEVTIQTLTSCALRWQKLDWWVIDILLLHFHYYHCCHICFSLQEKYKEEVVKNTVKASTTRKSSLTTGLSMTAEVEKNMDGEIDALFCLTLWIWDTVPLTTVDCFFLGFTLFDGVLDSREAMLPRRSSSFTSSGLTPRVSQIYLNYESMENQLRMTQDVLAAEQEDHRETRESVNAFNTQIQAF